MTPVRRCGWETVVALGRRALRRPATRIESPASRLEMMVERRGRGAGSPSEWLVSVRIRASCHAVEDYPLT